MNTRFASAGLPLVNLYAHMVCRVGALGHANPSQKLLDSDYRDLEQRVGFGVTGLSPRCFASRRRQTTIEEIADAAVISPRTFFRYFPSKEDACVSPTRRCSPPFPSPSMRGTATEARAICSRSSTRRPTLSPQSHGSSRSGPPTRARDGGELAPVLSSQMRNSLAAGPVKRMLERGCAASRWRVAQTGVRFQTNRLRAHPVEVEAPDVRNDPRHASTPLRSGREDAEERSKERDGQRYL
jgi:hypothetical protein